MRRIEISPFELAQRYIGLVLERPGGLNHPLIQWWFELCGYDPGTPDEVPWCSAMVNGIAHELRLPRSKSAGARTWLGVGEPVPLAFAEPGCDVIVIKRGNGKQPGPEVIKAQGHVGFFAGFDDEAQTVEILGGNQNNAISIAPFPASLVLGVRRLI